MYEYVAENIATAIVIIVNTMGKKFKLISNSSFLAPVADAGAKKHTLSTDGSGVHC